jgi:hypothetical protein
MPEAPCGDGAMIDVELSKQSADLCELVEAYRRLMLAVWLPDGSCAHPEVFDDVCRFCAAVVPEERA